jgi:AraC-like DNA-binding protein
MAHRPVPTRHIAKPVVPRLFSARCNTLWDDMGQRLRHNHLISTTDAGQMEAALRRCFDTRHFDVGNPRGTFAAEAGHRQFDPEIGLSYCAYDGDVDVEFPESQLVRVYVGLAGGALHSAPGYDGHLQAGRSVLLGSHVPVRSRFQTGVRQLVLRVEQASLCKTLEALTGRPIVGPVTFCSKGAVGEALSPVQSLVNILAQHLDEPPSPARSLLERELLQAVVVALLTGAPHNFSNLLTAPPQDVPRSKVDRAEAFIAANWDKPLSIEAIAREVGCSVRSLFKGFQTERGYTPILFLRRKRLEHAHDMLLQPAEVLSVADVATACGFSNAGHFARYYREQYGVLPSLTLRLGRSH